MGQKFVNADEIGKKLYIVASNFYGLAMSQSQFFDENNFDTEY